MVNIEVVQQTTLTITGGGNEEEASAPQEEGSYQKGREKVLRDRVLVLLLFSTKSKRQWAISFVI